MSTPLAPRPGLMFNNGPRIVFSCEHMYLLGKKTIQILSDGRKKVALTWPQMLMCKGGELAGRPTDSCGKCAGGPLDCGLCCGGGLYPTLDPPTFP